MTLVLLNKHIFKRTIVVFHWYTNVFFHWYKLCHSREDWMIEFAVMRQLGGLNGNRSLCDRNRISFAGVWRNFVETSNKRLRKLLDSMLS